MTSTFVTVRSSGRVRWSPSVRYARTVTRRADGCPAACAHRARRCDRREPDARRASCSSRCIGIHDAHRPIYGPIDEITHTAYVLAVAKDGLPPFVGRDRAFVGRPPIAARDVRIPPPDKVGSAPVPIGAARGGDAVRGDPAAALLLRRGAGDVVRVGSTTRSSRSACSTSSCCSARSRSSSSPSATSPHPRSAAASRRCCSRARAAMIDIFSFVTNGAIMLPLGAAAIWLGVARHPRPARDVAARRRLRRRSRSRRSSSCRSRPPACSRPPSPQLRATDGARRLRGSRAQDRRSPAIPLALWVALEPLALPLARAARARRTERRRLLGREHERGRTSTSSLAAYFSSLYTSIQEPFHWWSFSPYVVRLPAARRSPS